MVPTFQLWFQLPKRWHQKELEPHLLFFNWHWTPKSNERKNTSFVFKKWCYAKISFRTIFSLIKWFQNYWLQDIVTLLHYIKTEKITSLQNLYWCGFGSMFLDQTCFGSSISLQICLRLGSSNWCSRGLNQNIANAETWELLDLYFVYLS